MEPEKFCFRYKMQLQVSDVGFIGSVYESAYVGRSCFILLGLFDAAQVIDVEVISGLCFKIKRNRIGCLSEGLSSG